MAVGLSAVNMAAKILNIYRATNWTAPTTIYLQIHTSAGDPGSAGTSNVSAVTTRQAVTWSAPSSGSMTLSGTPTFSMTASETIRYISLWDASTAGNFLQSAQLTADVPVINGSTLNFSTLTLSYTPIAA
jgi:hypothetical protein